jgi:hypothetical protein
MTEENLEGKELESPFDSLNPSVFYGAIYPKVKEGVLFLSEGFKLQIS